ncbi:Laccase-14 [Striga hermonthica]|uniref:Laccase n=1 Tax=Striga hermonthica TaxID=68872 RepID=A0A9N7NJ04_STRHE|nr:Laccase-14 [Striga hermonthica]
MLWLLAIFLFGGFVHSHATTHYHSFVVVETPYNKLCSNKTILTVNGQFPGPTIYVTQGDTIVIDVINRARENVTIHWHGVKQPRYPWSDGPEYITQCPIQPGSMFNQRIVLSDEIGTMWWHAHSEWSRATVHGALIVLPKRKNDYPFPIPHAEIPIILGEWWKSDIRAVVSEFLENGGDPNVSDAFLINGQPGDLYPCSRQDTFKLTVDYGKRYLIRMVNAVMNNIMFFRIANHNVTIVGSDGAYTKQLTSDYIAISSGQTIDFLLEANQNPSHYYMAARVYNVAGTFDNTTTTAIIEYSGNYTPPPSPSLPTLPDINDTRASADFTGQLRSLASQDHPIDVPLNPTTILFFTLSINLRPCVNNSCAGPLGERLLASINNITFQQPRTAILEAYYERIKGVYRADFPSDPPLTFNYTADFVPVDLWRPENGTEVRLLEYNSTVELVFQGTNTVAGIDHPMHLHGHSFYVVGWGFGNFDKDRDPPNYNLVDPPLQNTIAVPRSGWTAIRFRANNPGVWLMHCHIERHVSWGMQMVFITKNGKGPNARMHPPPPDFPKCP